VLCCKRLLLGLFLVLLIALPRVAPAQASNAGPQALDSNVVLLEIRLDGHMLADSLSGFQFGARIFLPLGEIARLMTVGIRTAPQDGTARGFVRGEATPFSLNVGNRMVTIGDVTSSFDPALVLRQPDDLYVESKLLASWVLVDFDYDSTSLSIKLRPRQPLPLQMRLERESKLGQVTAPTRPVDPNYPRQENPYQLLAVPFIDQTISLGLRRSGDSKSRDATSTTYLRTDFLGFQASAFLSAGSNSDSAANRFTLGRSDPGGELLGPLHARSFAVGNVSVAGVPNIAHSSDVGNGFAVSNVPLDRASRFTTHTLQGDLPPGWDVELYLNKALIAYQQSRADGKYSFNDLNLVYGPNEFRLVFHGPQGQLRVERQDLLLDETLDEPGSFYYDISSNRDPTGLRRTAALAEWGFSKSVTVTGGTFDADRADGSHARYANLGMHAFAGGAILLANLTRQTGGGSLYQLGVRSRLAGVSVGWDHLDFHSFSSELFPATLDPMRMRDQLRLDGTLPGEWLGTFPFSLELQRDRFQSGASATDASALLSASWGGTSLSNMLHLTRGPAGKTLDGVFQVAGNAGQFRVRSQATYLLAPIRKLSALAFTAERSLGQGYLLNVGVNRSFQDGSVSLTSSLNKSFGNFAVALTGGLASRNNFNLGIQLFFGVGREPRRSQWLFDAVPMAESGAVSARVFIDRNGNGIMDGDEQPVKNIGFLVNSSTHAVRTDESGIAYLGHLPANRNTDIAVNPATVEDPQLAPTLKGIRVVPRPGIVTQVDFPLGATGEIDGTVFLIDAGRKRGIGNVLVELLDGKGAVVTSARSGSDGFFVLVEVLPGNYSLRIGQEQLKELKLRDSGTKSVTMPADGGFLNGQDFSVERL
jgi:hypothetical protein